MDASQTAETFSATSDRCVCGFFEVEVEHGDNVEDFEYAGTGCTHTTAHTFAPGHDAKLKSLLIRAGAGGHAVRRDEGGMSVIEDAVAVANRFGFGHQVSAGIKSALAKAEAKAQRRQVRADKIEAARVARELRMEQRDAAKADKPAARAPRTQAEQVVVLVPARIKVGRWEYDARINTADNSAHYTSANGETKSVPAGKYTLVESK